MLYQTQAYLPFLALSLAGYWAFCRTPRARALFLSLASAGFLGIAQLASVSFEYASAATTGLLLLTLAVFHLGSWLRHHPGALRLTLAIVAPLSILISFKYVLPLAHHFGALGEIAVPLGISYYTFKHVGFLIESSRGKFADATLIDYFAYILFFPMFAAGPIERFAAFKEELAAVSFSWNQASTAAERLLIGLIFKFVIAEMLIKIAIYPVPMTAEIASGMLWWQAFLAAFARFLYTYFDFAGYTHMVIGAGLLFGIKLMENFQAPLLRPNLAEFWRGWHISLSSWARDYIYFPILGNYRSPTLALLATFLMIGVWHSPAPGWALWGLHHGIGLSLLAAYHRWANDKQWATDIRLTIAWRVAATLATWWYVSIGYALTFVAFDLETSLRLYAKILTFGVLS